MRMRVRKLELDGLQGREFVPPMEMEGATVTVFGARAEVYIDGAPTPMLEAQRAMRKMGPHERDERVITIVMQQAMDDLGRVFEFWTAELEEV